MASKLKKLLALVLSVVMVFSLLGITAMADDLSVGSTTTTSETVAAGGAQTMPKPTDTIPAHTYWELTETSDPVSNGDAACGIEEDAVEWGTEWTEIEKTEYDANSADTAHYKTEQTTTPSSYSYTYEETTWRHNAGDPYTGNVGNIQYHSRWDDWYVREDGDYYWLDRTEVPGSAVTTYYKLSSTTHSHSEACYAHDYTYTWTLTAEPTFSAYITLSGRNIAKNNIPVTVNNETKNTNNSGKVTFTGLYAGSYTATVSTAAAFGTADFSITNSNVNVTLSLSAIQAYSIGHIDIEKDTGATGITIPSSATVVATYADGSSATLGNVGSGGTNQWRYTGLKDGSYIANTSDSSSTRIVSFTVTYSVAGNNYSYTGSGYATLESARQNCPGKSGLDAPVLGSTTTNHYFYKVVYRYYTGSTLDATDSTGTVQQVTSASVTLTPASTKTNNSLSYNLSSASSAYTSVDISESKNSNTSFVTITLDYSRSVPNYNVSYSFISGTEGKTLPAGVTSQCPQNTTAADGSTVTAATSFSSVNETTASGAITGTWSFNSWDSSPKTIEGADISFVGTWLFAPNGQGSVSYEYVSGTNGKTLPASISTGSGTYAIADGDSYYIGVNVENLSTLAAGATCDETNASGAVVGTWTFTGWDKTNANMTATGVKFTGTWTFAAAASYTVSYVYVKGATTETLPSDISVSSGTYAVSDSNSYYNGETVTRNSPASSSYTVTDANGVTTGTWNLTWDKNSAVVDKANETFTGTWNHSSARQYYLSYAWAIGSPVPSDAPDLTGSSYKASYLAGAAVTVAAEPSTSSTTNGTEQGAWSFEGWDSSALTDGKMPASDATIYGTWSFVEDTKYPVSYSYVSGTEGKDLPAAISTTSGAYAIADSTKYYAGDTVANLLTVPNGTKYDVKETINSEEVTTGTWTLAWNKSSDTMTDKGLAFVGTWTFTAANQYGVTYSIVSGTNGKDLPAGLTTAFNSAKQTTAGVNAQYYVGQTAANAMQAGFSDNAATPYTFKDTTGVWKMVSWSSNPTDAKMVTTGVAYTGTLQFTENGTGTVTVRYFDAANYVSATNTGAALTDADTSTIEAKPGGTTTTVDLTSIQKKIDKYTYQSSSSLEVTYVEGETIYIDLLYTRDEGQLIVSKTSTGYAFKQGDALSFSILDANSASAGTVTLTYNGTAWASQSVMLPTGTYTVVENRLSDAANTAYREDYILAASGDEGTPGSVTVNLVTAEYEGDNVTNPSRAAFVNTYTRPEAFLLVHHVYYTDVTTISSTGTSTYRRTDTPSEQQVDELHLGDDVTVADYYSTTANGNSDYSVIADAADAGKVITLEEGQNDVTINYLRQETSVEPLIPSDIPETDIPETDVPETNIPETDTPTTDAPVDPTTPVDPDIDIPDDDVPETNIPETNVPTTSTPVEEDTVTIEDEDTPKADAPQTGDSTSSALLWVLFVLSALGLGAMAVSSLKGKARRHGNR